MLMSFLRPWRKGNSNNSGVFTADRLSPEEAKQLRERLKGLYALLKNNPALMDRRLQVGSKRPQIPSHIYQQQQQQQQELYDHDVSREDLFNWD
jgi:hypothetical protein